mgnify:CR=1 FL=1
MKARILFWLKIGVSVALLGYLLSLIEERKLAFSSCNVALHGLQVTMTFAAVMFGIAVYL